jgi:hypothetical protein
LHAALPGSLARQPCPAALPGSLARQPCPEAWPGRIASILTAVGRNASLHTFISAGSLVQAFHAINKTYHAILSLSWPQTNELYSRVVLSFFQHKVKSLVFVAFWPQFGKTLLLLYSCFAPPHIQKKVVSVK